MSKLGQHFLKSQKVLDIITCAIQPEDEEAIIEIGPGHGELTRKLITQNLKLKTIAIEKDGKLAKQLTARFKYIPGIEILEGDALQILPGVIAALGSQPYKLVGNIPYYITGKLLRIIGTLPKRPAKCVFTIQTEVADRLTAVPPRMNRLAASVALWGLPRILARVSRKDFSPPPEVDSAVIELDSRGKPLDIDPEKYYRTVRILFAQPRKTILNNLAGASATSKSDAESLLQRLEIKSDLRPQNLTIENIIQIAHSL